MILKLFILAFLYFACVRCAVNYCDLPCKDYTGATVENSACKCQLGSCSGDVKELVPDKETKNYIVKLLNDCRQKIASGSENFPGASNMVALVYDDNVGYVAQCHAKKCIAGHDVCRRTSQFPLVGQNFYMQGGGSSCSNKGMFKAAVDAWYQEISQFTQSCLDSYSGCAGHFTQIIWADTTNVGCGRISFGDNVCHIFCNFGPAGNVMAQPVYKPGSPTCETEPGYSHLCKNKGAPKSEFGPVSSENAVNFNLHCTVIMFLTHLYTLCNN